MPTAKGRVRAEWLASALVPGGHGIPPPFSLLAPAIFVPCPGKYWL